MRARPPPAPPFGRLAGPPGSLPVWAGSIAWRPELETTESRAWQHVHPLPGFQMTPWIPPDPRLPSPGRRRLHLTSPPALCDERQWCKIRWGEKQEVVPESKAWLQKRGPGGGRSSPSTRSLTGKWSGGQPRPRCGGVGAARGTPAWDPLATRGFIFSPNITPTSCILYLLLPSHRTSKVSTMSPLYR